VFSRGQVGGFFSVDLIVSVGVGWSCNLLAGKQGVAYAIPKKLPRRGRPGPLCCRGPAAIFSPAPSARPGPGGVTRQRLFGGERYLTPCLPATNFNDFQISNFRTTTDFQNASL
jgi:hypothetical protein